MEPVISFDLHKPPAGSRHLLRSLHAQLRDRILGGGLQPGVQLPSSRELASALQVGRNTAIALYELLASEGYVVTRPGGGTYVTEVMPARRTRRAPQAVADARLNPAWRNRTPVTFVRPVLRHDFSVGMPDESLFPFDIWRRLCVRTLRRLGERAHGYQAPLGMEELRSAVCGHLSQSRAIAASPDDIAICNGAQHAFHLLAQILVVPGKTVVAVEDPGYPPLRWALEAAGARLVPVPVDREGIDVSRLPADASVVCVTPSHQYPLGMPMSLERRKQLLAWANKRNGVVVEDDYDSEFRYGARPLDALKALDAADRVFYVGTFSKSLFPALRIGYSVLPAWARDAFATARQIADWHTPVAEQITLAAFIREGHLVRHLRRARAVYARRREQIIDGVLRHLAAHAELIPSEAGLHIACRFGPTSKARAAEELAQESGIGINSFAPLAARTSGFMLGLGRVREERIDKGLRQLASVLESQALAGAKR
jgi:GntR family transcriptional regulator/MocR family aminotransferase